MEIKLKCLETNTNDDGSILSTFEIEPLERGFGITLGNALRRICLSHIEGTALTAIRIEGALHEFTVIKGVVQDVVEIVLNLKTLVFRAEQNEAINLTLNFKGPGEVYGEHIDLPAGVELVNPKQHIATVTEATDLNISAILGKGCGYVLADEQNIVGQAVDFIPIDSSFMPIKRFSYKVDQIRIGESSEASTRKFEKLIFEVLSNGSILPEEAIKVAARLMLHKIQPILNLSGEAFLPLSPSYSQAASPTVVREAAKDSKDFSDVGIESLNLSVRAYNCLKRANKNHLQDLLDMTTEELMGIKNFGKKSAEEVIKTLNDKGFFLIDDPRSKEPQPA